MKFGQGVYRFKPDGSGFEFITGSTNNTWGLGFSETFDVFGSTANNDPSFYVAIPNRYFEGVPGPERRRPPGERAGLPERAQFYDAHFLTPYIRQVDVFGGYTAAAGHQLYTARSFPKAYWNRIAFITEPTAHIVGQGILEKHGAGFVTRDGWNLLAGAEEWVAPVHAQAGPDGAVWVADWYNFIAQHNPTPPGLQQRPGQRLRDVDARPHRGRIYRVVYKGAAARRRRSRCRQPTDPAGPRGGALVRQHAVAAARAAPARRARAAATWCRSSWRSSATRCRRDRPERRRDARALDAARARRARRPDDATPVGRRSRRWRIRRPACARRRRWCCRARPGGARRSSTRASCATPTCTRGWRCCWRSPSCRRPTPIGAALYAASQEPVNYGDRWLSRALFMAAHRHKEAVPHRVPRRSARGAGQRAADRAAPRRHPPRLARARTRRRSRPTGRHMEVPGSWESRGLPDFDGVVWFTRYDRRARRRAQAHGSASAGSERRGDLGERPASRRRSRRDPPTPTPMFTRARRRPPRGRQHAHRCASRTCAATAASSARPR